MLRLPFRAPWFRADTIRAHRPAPRRASLRLEELESRALLSASSLTDWAASPHLGNVTPLAGTSAASIYTPAQVRAAYGFNNLPYDGAGQTIAIVDAYDDPTIAADLAVFDQQFGLAAPPSFVKATPQGQPAADAGWSSEIALDVEWAHVIAPRASILLVEAKSSGGTDLLNAADYARRQPGVVAVSMSWGSPEFSGESATDATFTTPAGHNGVVFIASAGDNGAAQGPEWPSVSPNVVAVGGTALYLNGSSYGSETGWTNGGGGYSKFEPRPSYQQGFQGASWRSAPDVAYNADPKTGVYVYSAGGWYSIGGTSAGAPQWAGLVALADQARGGQGALDNLTPLLYGLSSADFHDVTTGNNTYDARAGYDLVTGRGSPFADRVVRDLIGITANRIAVPAGQPSRTAAPVQPPPLSHRFDGGETTVVPLLASLRVSEVALVPAPPAPRAAEDRVWFVEHAPLPLAATPGREATSLPRAEVLSALCWSEDDGMSRDGDAEM